MGIVVVAMAWMVVGIVLGVIGLDVYRRTWGTPEPVLTPPAPAPKFGLAQAEAAMRFASDSSQTAAVRGVVVGVLGYEDTVAADAKKEDELCAGEIVRRDESIKSLRNEIAHHEHAIAANQGRREVVGRVAGLFTAH